MTEDELLEKLLSKKRLTRIEKERLRKAYPIEKFEVIILKLSRVKGNQGMIKQLYKAQNILYSKKKPKIFRVVPTFGGNVVKSMTSGGSPGLGKKR